MYELVYLPVAGEDITDIVLYIADRLKAPKAAMELLDELDNSIALLGDFPYAHRIFHTIKPLKEEYRMVPVKNHAVFYVVREKEKIVEIHRVVYAKMDLLNTLSDNTK
jgi:toxin ParE1/3/4